MADDYSKMTPQELQSVRTRLADDLADSEEMAAYDSINSAAHATSSERAATGTRLRRLKDSIAEIDALLGDPPS